MHEAWILGALASRRPGLAAIVFVFALEHRQELSRSCASSVKEGRELDPGATEHEAREQCVHL
jgi:hypothetical protein